MRGIRIPTLFAIAGAAWLLVSCSDESTTPTAVDRASLAVIPLADVSTTQLDPFTFRAPIDPYQILQLPDFMMRSHTRSDIVMQRSVFVPGAGAWHMHPGPSFVYVIQGQIKLTEYSAKDGCTDTPVRGPGEAYFEEGDHVHRAVVLSSENAVLLVTRFNIPVGGPITISVPAPAC
jgi:quercetin dioxygenase-like cupin family protein